MAILRPLAELAAQAAREAFDIAYQGLVDTVSDDPRGWIIIPEPASVPFVPIREGKSLHTLVKRRFKFKRKIFERWSEQ